MALSISKDTKHSCEASKEDANVNSSLTEERRLLKSERRPHSKRVTGQIPEKRLSKFNTRANQMTPEQVDDELRKRQLSISGTIEIRRSRLKYHNKAELTYQCENPLTMIEQNFEYIAVVDFEATCDRQQEKDYQHEIIEFPIVLIDVQKQTIVDQFQSYCRPTIKPILSDFCTELTGIEQHQVDAAPLFPEVLRNAERWLNERNLFSSSNKHKLAFATDGPWDFANFLRTQCQLSSISYPSWAQKWIDIRKEFSSFYAIRRCGIGGMLGKVGLSFDGRRHSGLDDSINIARVALELIKDGCVLSLNDGLHECDLKSTRMMTSNNDKTQVDDDSIVFEN